MKRLIYLLFSTTLLVACVDFSRGEYVNQSVLEELTVYIAVDATSNIEYRLSFLASNRVSLSQTAESRSTYIFHDYYILQSGNFGEIKNMDTTYFTFEISNSTLKLTTTTAGTQAGFKVPTDWTLKAD
ncbi:MAG: hypothetical protein IIW10_04055 [Spirochaetaceae bacterium]|nr:hypothetical protein [Spirochaetaceae bacterium]